MLNRPLLNRPLLNRPLLQRGAARWRPLFRPLLLSLLMSLLLTACGPDKAPVGHVPARPAPSAAASPAEPVAVRRLTLRFDTAAVGVAFGASRLFRPYRASATAFYAARAGRLGWFGADGTPVPQVDQLLKRLGSTAAEGLDPRRYRAARLQHLLRVADSARTGADSSLLIPALRAADLALTGTWFILIGDHWQGAADPALNDARAWSKRRKYFRLDASLARVLAQSDTVAATYAFRPRHPEYTRLRTVLRAYQQLQKAGGWGTVPTLTRRRLEPDSVDARFVPALRRRLLREARAVAPPDSVPDAQLSAGAQLARQRAAALGAPSADPTRYDSVLVAAVAALQERLGLIDDGIIGPATVAALNVPVSRRIGQMQVNLERWRWVPRRLGPNHILVNIPEFKLHLVQGGRETLEMRVIVGQKMKATPLFTDDLRYVVLAPYWNVPTSIVVAEVARAVRRNPRYLEREKMEVVEGKDKVVPAKAVDWVAVSQGKWGGSRRLRQRAGGSNPLGPVKFILPNDNDVYLHGTPFQALFDKRGRGFSHGCVRVENPYALAQALLNLEQPDWTEERVRATVAEGKETWIILKKGIPVFLVYFTAWVSPEDGAVHFRDDIYGHDWKVSRALGQ